MFSWKHEPDSYWPPCSARGKERRQGSRRRSVTRAWCLQLNQKQKHPCPTDWTDLASVASPDTMLF